MNYTKENSHCQSLPEQSLQAAAPPARVQPGFRVFCAYFCLAIFWYSMGRMPELFLNSSANRLEVV